MVEVMKFNQAFFFFSPTQHALAVWLLRKLKKPIKNTKKQVLTPHSPPFFSLWQIVEAEFWAFLSFLHYSLNYTQQFTKEFSYKLA